MPIFDIMDKEGFSNWFKETYRSRAAFYDGDPEQGGKRITFFEHLESMGINFIPTSDFERMKIVREESYRNELKELMDRRKWNAGIETNESDIKEFRRLWLTDELDRIKGWENSNPQDRPENLLELKKYTRYINIEFETLEIISQQWKPLSNLNEYLLHLNRLLAGLPNKLALLFPHAKLLPKDQWSESNRLLPNDYLAAVHRYSRLDFNCDIDLLQNIRLDPDFAFYLKDPSVSVKRIREQADNIQNVFDYLRMCQTYTSDFDINNVDKGKTALWSVISGITEIMDWLVSLSELLNSCLPKTQNDLASSTAFYTDDKGNISLSKTANYRDTNIWLRNRLHLALVSADDTVVNWINSFLSDLKVEPDRAEIVFNKHREHYLTQRQQYIQHNNLYSEFFDKQGGFSEDMLQALTNRVQTMYLNSTHSLLPETLVERVYANNFMLNRLNAWKVENDTHNSLHTSIGTERNTLNQPIITINIDVQNDFYCILKPYFTENQHNILYKRLQGFEDSNDKLLFNENGNKLADAFKQLYNAQLIVGCQKVDLEKWIGRNFCFTDPKTKQTKGFTAKYLGKIISSNTGCQSPIINIIKVDSRFKVEPVQRIKKKNDII
ncbi:hypothetical protein [Spirosoma pulveris]